MKSIWIGASGWVYPHWMGRFVRLACLNKEGTYGTEEDICARIRD